MRNICGQLFFKCRKNIFVHKWNNFVRMMTAKFLLCDKIVPSGHQTLTIPLWYPTIKFYFYQLHPAGIASRNNSSRQSVVMILFRACVTHRGALCQTSFYFADHEPENRFARLIIAHCVLITATSTTTTTKTVSSSPTKRYWDLINLGCLWGSIPTAATIERLLGLGLKAQ